MPHDASKPSSANPAAEPAERGSISRLPDPNASILDQMGGVKGLVFSSIPIAAFVPANAIWGLTVAIWAAVGMAVVLLLWSLARRENLQPAISGFIVVGVCSIIAWRMGSAKGFFLYGIVVQAIYGLAFVVSIAIRWPLVGVIWGFLEGHGTTWRKNRRALTWYSIATAMWAALFAIRAALQFYLYQNDEVAWLGTARVVMGWPLAIVAFLGTVWAVRQGLKGEAAAEEPESPVSRGH